MKNVWKRINYGKLKTTTNRRKYLEAKRNVLDSRERLEQSIDILLECIEQAKVKDSLVFKGVMKLMFCMI